MAGRDSGTGGWVVGGGTVLGKKKVLHDVMWPEMVVYRPYRTKATRESMRGSSRGSAEPYNARQ